MNNIKELEQKAEELLVGLQMLRDDNGVMVSVNTSDIRDSLQDVFDYLRENNITGYMLIPKQ